MELNKLKALSVISETGSLSAAAKKLGYTTSGISRMMASLEEELGIPLLIRKNDGVRLTDECSQLIPEIRECLFHEERLVQAAGEIKGITSGNITIGTAYSGYFNQLQGAVKRFNGKFPGIHFRMQGGYSTELLERLHDHSIDLCISTMRETENTDLIWKPLAVDEMVAWVPASSPLAEKKSVPLSICETENFIDIYPDQDVDNNRIFKEHHITPNKQMDANDSFTAYSMVSAGLGITMNSRLNSPAGGPGVVQVPFDPPIRINIGVATRKDISPAAEKFVNFLC